MRELRYDAFYGTPLDHLLLLWGIDTLVICGTVANIWSRRSARLRSCSRAGSRPQRAFAYEASALDGTR